MIEDVIAHCQERYQECVASRNARMEAVLAAKQPGDTQAQLAERAGVSLRTVKYAVAQQKLLQKVQGGTFCNKEVNSDFINGPLPKLKWRKLYPWSEDRDNEPEIAAVKRAIARCSLDQRAYLWAQVYPVYEPATVERKNDDGTISVRPLI